MTKADVGKLIVDSEGGEKAVRVPECRCGEF